MYKFDIKKFIEYFKFDFKASIKAKVFFIVTNIILAVIIFLIFFIVAKIVSNKVKYIGSKKDKSSEEIAATKLYHHFIAKFIFYIILLIGFIIAAVKLGFNLNTLLVVLGSIGIAFALCLQNVLSQFVSGIVILTFNYFNLNDYIQLNNDQGYVSEFNLLNTTLTDSNGLKIVIPNNSIISGAFTNYSTNKEVYAAIDFTVSNNDNINYKSLIEKVKRVIASSEYASDKTTANAFITDMATSGTKLRAKVKTSNPNYWKCMSDIRLRVRDLLSKENVLMLDNNYSAAKGF